MNNLQIDQILRDNISSRRYYIGTFNVNNIPNNINRRIALLIVNTEENVQRMGHWVAFAIIGKKILFFDSFAFHPVKFYKGKIAELFLRYGQRINVVPSAIQHSRSLTCGAHCIYFIHSIAIGMSHRKLMRKYSLRDKLKNDNFATKYLFLLNKNKQECRDKLCSMKMFKSFCFEKCRCNHV